MKQFIIFISLGVVAIILGLQFTDSHPQVHYTYSVEVLSATSTADKVTEPKHVTLLAFGDMMLDRQVRLFINEYGQDYPFKHISSLFSGNDLIFTNIEGSVTNNPSKTADLKGKYLHFTFDPSMMQVLKNYGFNVVSLANNHMYDFFRAGYLETKNHLEAAGIAYFGDPYNKESISVVKDVRGLKIAFVGYHEFYSTSTVPVVNEIKRLKDEADVIIVAPHWGYEYQKNHSRQQQIRAHEFIDAGATIVLGAHPHVIQPIEIYKDKPIFYSVGNFIFDQDFSFDTTHGLALRIEFIKNPNNNSIETSINILPITIQKSQASVSEQFVKEKILKELASISNVSPELKSNIQKGTLVFSL